MAYGDMPYRILSETSEVGRNRMLLECPWCGDEVTAYRWSLAGSGKRCPNCRSLFTYSGICRKGPD